MRLLGRAMCLVVVGMRDETRTLNCVWNARLLGCHCQSLTTIHGEKGQAIVKPGRLQNVRQPVDSVAQ